MKNLILAISFIITTCMISAQSKTYISSSLLKQEITFKTEFVKRNITISTDKIIIPNFYNGGKKNAILKIDKKVDKVFFLSGICTWYYCTDTENDPINGQQKAIVIYLKSEKKIDLYLFADEVTIYSYQFLLD